MVFHIIFRDSTFWYQSLTDAEEVIPVKEESLDCTAIQFRDSLSDINKK